jgi:hypothetical protein
MGDKSVVVSMEITVVQRAHDCQSNSSHRLTKGMSRLTIKEDRSELNYCLPCAKKFLAKGIAKLTAVQAEVDGLLGPANEQA